MYSANFFAFVAFVPFTISTNLYKDISCSQVNLDLLKLLKCNLVQESLLNSLNCYKYWTGDIFSTLEERCLAFAYDAVTYQCASCCGKGDVTLPSLAGWSSFYILGEYERMTLSLLTTQT